MLVVSRSLFPQGSEASLVLAERRFRPCPPLGGAGPVVVAPVDGTDVVALDPTNGRTLWTAPRGDARLCVSGPGGEVLLLGRRLVVLDRKTGRVRVRGPALREEIIAQPTVYQEELVAATRNELVRLGLADGKIRSRYRFEEPSLEAGPAIALDGQLATVGFSRLNIYSSFEDAVRELAEDYGDRPEHGVLLGQLHARRGARARFLPRELPGHHLQHAVAPGPVVGAGVARAEDQVQQARAGRGDAVQEGVVAPDGLGRRLQARNHSDRTLEYGYRVPSRIG